MSKFDARCIPLSSESTESPTMNSNPTKSSSLPPSVQTSGNKSWTDKFTIVCLMIFTFVFTICMFAAQNRYLREHLLEARNNGEAQSLLIDNSSDDSISVNIYPQIKENIKEAISNNFNQAIN